MQENDYINKSAEDLENSETMNNLMKDGLKYKNVNDANATEIKKFIGEPKEFLKKPMQFTTGSRLRILSSKVSN